MISDEIRGVASLAAPEKIKQPLCHGNSCPRCGKCCDWLYDGNFDRDFQRYRANLGYDVLNGNRWHRRANGPSITCSYWFDSHFGSEERTPKELPASSSLTYVQEIKIADQLFNVFEPIWTSTSYNEKNEIILDHNTMDNEIEECEEDLDYEAKDEENPVFESFSLSYMKRALDYYDAINTKTGKRSHTWRNVRNKFRRIKDQSYMSRFRDYIEERGTKKQKVDSVGDYDYNNFDRARDLLCAVHDIDFKRWAVVTKREIVNEAEIQKSADQFVSEVKSLLPYYNEDSVLNTDQAELQRQFPSTQTFSYQGEKTILATVRSVNATTHSYTVQPTIIMSGKIFGPVYICLKEVNGRVSDNIKANLPQLKNIAVTCGASGKLTTSLVKYWRNECLIPSLTSQPVLLLSDSWS
ncbi:unnamed protein product [Adineta ricciae]|uniref:Uncharacterized protein n=1 Tax=Adineta ricciae TaxID=249248 RepID=A0A815LQR8_ADIRI|nr:unnamed protein product [Adineta ricciae]CAF1413202.1 unnamed protein product [Adineta ricciae]